MGDDANQGYGDGLVVIDPEGDGIEELMVASSGDGTTPGRVFALAHDLQGEPLATWRPRDSSDLPIRGFGVDLVTSAAACSCRRAACSTPRQGSAGSRGCGGVFRGEATVRW